MTIYKQKEQHGKENGYLWFDRILKTYEKNSDLTEPLTRRDMLNVTNLYWL